jgi:hypothetical protein
MWRKLFHIGGVAIQIVGGGGAAVLGVPLKIAAGVWAVGKVLEAFGVHTKLPDTPPK